MDQLILEFVGSNWLTLGLGLMFIKGIAKITPGEWDDKIADLFSDMLNFVRKDK
jgi:hypothetical protein